MIRWTVALIALCIVQAALAQAPVQQGVGGIPAGLAQKQAFARSMIEDASTAERIQASRDAEALRLFTLAKDTYTRALAALGQGDFAGAEKQLNEAMSAIGKARRLAPDAAVLATKQRADFAKKLESVEALEKSYRSYLKGAGRKSGTPGNEADEFASLGISRLVDAAKKHAKEDRPDDALRTLEKAEQVMRSALNRVMGSTMVEYTQKFETPAEEYAFEIERNRSYLEMIPVAIAEFKPSDEAKLNIESLVKEDREAVEQALKYAGQKDYVRALASVRMGTDYLLNALVVAGLVMPQ